MARTFTIHLDWIPPEGLRGNASTWTHGMKMKKVRLTDEARVSGGWHGLEAKQTYQDDTPIFKATIQYTFHHSTKIDVDNLGIGMKPFLDGLVDSDLLTDDDPDHLQHLAPEFVKCGKGQSRTIVEIRELSDSV